MSETKKEIILDGVTYVLKEPPEPDLNDYIGCTTLKVRKHETFKNEVIINFGCSGEDYRYNYNEISSIIKWFEGIRDGYFPGGKRFDA